MQVFLVIVNYLDLEYICILFEIFFVCIFVSWDIKVDVEQQILELLEQNKVEFVVLVKYMQVLSSDFFECFFQVINIYYLFLLVFKGVQLYYWVWDCGVKFIGVIVYYVIEDLDDGLIIE